MNQFAKRVEANFHAFMDAHNIKPEFNIWMKDQIWIFIE